MKGQDIGFDDTVLIQRASMEIRGKDRIIISGPNGSGKTTLVKYLVAALTKKEQTDTMKIGNDIAFDYFDQHNEIVQTQETVYSRYAKNVKIKTDESSIRSQLAFIGLSQQEINNSMDILSYGQKVKVKFLQMLSGPIDVLILDEPTNHLDIPTRETIEDMLDGYQGALILVSHDQYFADKVNTNICYGIKDNKLMYNIILSKE